MKVTITAGNLGQGLQVVSRAVSSRTTLPILNNVLLQTADTGLQLTATNLEIGIRQVIPAEIQEEGGITVPARLLTDFVTSHPDEPLSMALDKKTQSLAVKSNRFDATRSEEHTSELQSPCNLVCRLLLEKKKNIPP